MDLAYALEHNRFIIMIQPKVEITTGKAVAAEALVRLIDEHGNMILPGKFIPLLESENMIYDLDEYVFKSVCIYQSEMQKKRNRVVPVSVNLSRKSLGRRDIIERYLKIAVAKGVEPSLVPIEITESAIASDEKLAKVCTEFVDKGFVIHLDDFGKGYSSFSSLATLPLSVLKIDKSLIDHIHSHKGSIIVNGIIKTAKELDLKVVAEGVEEKNQAIALAKMGCDQIQGFYYAQPMQIAEFKLLMKKPISFLEKRIKLDDNHDCKRIRLNSRMRLKDMLQSGHRLQPVEKLVKNA